MACTNNSIKLSHLGLFREQGVFSPPFFKITCKAFKINKFSFLDQPQM